jgi:hypothetical protein
MGIDELLVTLKMMDIKYYITSDSNGNYLEFRYDMNSEEIKTIVILLKQYNFGWNYIAIGGKLQGIYLTYK